MAVLGSDNHGVGGSSGDWRTESFDYLASDAMAESDCDHRVSELQSRLHDK
jgi:hypothetical protein